ncbi:MAG: T9SS type A sorting domain-containing protein, partial [Bacteroidota bacterium]
ETHLGVKRFFRSFDTANRLKQEVEHYFDPRRQNYVPSLKQVWVYPHQDFKSLNEFALYPQPTTGPISIHFLRQNSKPIRLQLFDPSGKVLSSQDITQTESSFGMSLQSPTEVAGLYFIRVFYEDGSSRTQKWILEP